MHQDANNDREKRKLIREIDQKLKDVDEIADLLGQARLVIMEKSPPGPSTPVTRPSDDVTGSAASKKPATPNPITASKQVAIHLTLTWEPDDSAIANIDGKDFTLAPLPGKLLEILAADDGSGKDTYIPWKPRKEVLKQLAKKTGKQRTSRGLNSLLHRLRKHLKPVFSRKIVQVSSRRRALRFALLRRPAAVMQPRVIG